VAAHRGDNSPDTSLFVETRDDCGALDRPVHGTCNILEECEDDKSLA
jgi:hypothetical protein